MVFSTGVHIPNGSNIFPLEVDRDHVKEDSLYVWIRKQRLRSRNPFALSQPDDNSPVRSYSGTKVLTEIVSGKEVRENDLKEIDPSKVPYEIRLQLEKSKVSTSPDKQLGSVKEDELHSSYKEIEPPLRLKRPFLIQVIFTICRLVQDIFSSLINICMRALIYSPGNNRSLISPRLDVVSKFDERSAILEDNIMIADSTSSETDVLDDEWNSSEPKLKKPLNLIEERITVIDSESNEETDSFEEEDF